MLYSPTLNWITDNIIKIIFQFVSESGDDRKISAIVNSGIPDPNRKGITGVGIQPVFVGSNGFSGYS